MLFLAPFTHNTSVTDRQTDRQTDEPTDRRTNDNHDNSSTVTKVQSAKNHRAKF